MNKGIMNLVVKAIDNATPTLRKIGKGFGTLKNAGSAIGGGLQKLALGAVGIATAVAGFTIAATKAAIDEEKQIARLNSVLKTRGMLTDANSAAVEKQIGKLENLAFADDAVRESLITATQFTKNFNEALKIQNVAADVAAAKGISLEEATALVGKAYQGNTKGLKGLGVQVKKGAKATDILTAITKKYKGAAEAAADTTSGRFSKAQIKINNLIEDFGAKFLPYANEGLAFLNDTALPALGNALDTVAPIIQNVGKALGDTFGPIIQDNITNLTKPGGVFDSVGKVVGPIFEELGKKVGTFIGVLTGPDGLLTSIGTIVGALWGDGKGPLAFAVNAIGGAIGLLFDIITNVVGAISSLVKGIADFLTGTGEADAYQAELDRREKAKNFGGVFSQPLSGGGGFIIPTPNMGGLNGPTYAGGNVGTSYGAPEFKVIVGQKEFSATVTDSLGRIVDTFTPGR